MHIPSNKHRFCCDISTTPRSRQAAVRALVDSIPSQPPSWFSGGPHKNVSVCDWPPQYASSAAFPHSLLLILYGSYGNRKTRQAHLKCPIQAHRGRHATTRIKAGLLLVPLLHVQRRATPYSRLTGWPPLRTSNSSRSANTNRKRVSLGCSTVTLQESLIHFTRPGCPARLP